MFFSKTIIKTEATDGLSVPQGIHYNNNIWYSWLKLERREFFFVSARNIDFITVRTHVRLSISFLTVLNLLALPTQREIGDENQLRFLFDSLIGQKGKVVTTELIFLRQDNVNRHIFFIEYNGTNKSFFYFVTLGQNLLISNRTFYVTEPLNLSSVLDWSQQIF